MICIWDLGLLMFAQAEGGFIDFEYLAYYSY